MQGWSVWHVPKIPIGAQESGDSTTYVIPSASRDWVKSDTDKLQPPEKSFDLRNLRVVTSTGSVLSAEIYDWFYSTGFPSQTQLISMSGGTDIAGCCTYHLIKSDRHR